MESIPTYIINGRFDIITPVSSSYLLHNNLPNSYYKIIQNAAHSAYDMKEELLKITDNILKK